jgi:hypothetical protein
MLDSVADGKGHTRQAVDDLSYHTCNADSGLANILGDAQFILIA